MVDPILGISFQMSASLIGHMSQAPLFLSQ